MAVIDEVVLRRQARWGALYALHAVRQLYIEQKVASHPSWTELDVVNALEVGDYPLVMPAAPVGTVWSLPSEPPRQDLLTTLYSIDHAMLFDHETPESRRAQPSVWGGGSDYAELDAPAVQAAVCPPAELSTTLQRRRNKTAP
ncbi:hypothetical protein NBRC10512_006669 [Rhodotorula toruloides]|uniref:RHTO0S18e01970g1_1 n=2 Tax=Rhodotorula toruloides TaxID=5286 RepID=A0A061BF08_RHOTO|nr:uncharacterized protein RHTO_01916 [Rhodotorula toruloides NP11]EMS21450.1 hypothetical protein RHTO_01916 [Rhodotorula toruloides NP11]CDR48525.1 RHTO0S18e01970g1_1 [Rhodotorula toruloides]